MILFDVLITSIFGAGGSNNRNEEDPNFYNVEAYVTLNPYAQSNLYGQYSWFLGEDFMKFMAIALAL